MRQSAITIEICGEAGEIVIESPRQGSGRRL